MNSNILQNIILFISLFLIQVVILDNILLFGYINPFLYVLFVIVFPFRKGRGFFLFLCFLLGLLIDFFSNSGGTNAAATLFIGYIRLPLLKTILRKSDIDFLVFNITKQPFLKILSYTSILVLTHSVLIFSLEYFSFADIGIILNRSLLTSIFTIILIMFSIVLLTRKK
tara:strand:+ start:58400 stop:58906 length:507 start_codon:yes stop_codon:yes gene_type:complete